MNLQHAVIQKYRKIYPNHTLRETSAQTGIQLTRVFRIFNGQEMKISEYEKFREVILKSSQGRDVEAKFHVMSNLRKLKQEQIETISQDIQYLICNNQFLTDHTFSISSGLKA